MLFVRLIDVGGQRSERMKWKHCFADVTAVIFLVAISEYDQALLEDASVNRMHESLALFDSVVNRDPFKTTPIMLFFNKTDIFAKKIVRSPINQYFPEYDGGAFVENGQQFFTQLFLRMDRSGLSRIYVHHTNALDTSQIKFVMGTVNDIFVQQNLRRANLL